MLDKLVWLKDGQEIDFSKDEIKDNFEVKADGPKYTLVIKKPQLEDEAKYTVKVRDTDVSSAANLSVTEGPLEFTKPLADFELKENQTARFECELNKPDIPVKWFKNGEELEKGDKNFQFISDGKRHSLVIKKCDPSDSGKYTVKTTGPFSSCNFNVDG